MPWSRRDSEVSDYSCAYELDLDDLEEADLVKLKLPELPPHVRDAFRSVARGDDAALGAALDGDANLVFAMNRGGSSLLEVAAERGHSACVDLLRAHERALALRRERPAVVLEEASGGSDDDDGDRGSAAAAASFFVDVAPTSPLTPVGAAPDDDDDECGAGAPLSLDAWLEANDLADVAAAVSTLAEDVDDLREMADDDIAEVLDAAALGGARRAACDATLRAALCALGARVSPPRDSDEPDRDREPEPTPDPRPPPTEPAEPDLFAERGDFDDVDEGGDDEVPHVRTNLLVPLPQVDGIVHQLEKKKKWTPSPRHPPTPPTPPAVSPATPDHKTASVEPTFTELGKDPRLTTPKPALRPKANSANPFSEVRDAAEIWPACPFSEASHTVSPVTPITSLRDDGAS